jgi:predicted RNase H-like HicB family nuclease
MGVTDYIATAMARARFELLKSGLILGTIPGFNGVWAEGRSLDACRNELQEVLEDWIVLKLRDGDRLPMVGKQMLKVPSAAPA